MAVLSSTGSHLELLQGLDANQQLLFIGSSELSHFLLTIPELKSWDTGNIVFRGCLR